LHEKWTRAIKRQRKNWDGPQSTRCFAQNTLNPTALSQKDAAIVMKLDYQQKHLKPDAVPTTFPCPIHGDGRPAEKRQHQAVSNKMHRY